MKTIITVIAVSALALVMSTAMAGSKTVATKVAAKKPPSFLFVVSAKEGKIKKSKDGGHVFEMDKADIDRVIQFSDRPYRIVKYITGSDLAKDWSKGENSFTKDPPNAVLSGANLKPHIVILNGVKVDGKTITFKLDSRAGHDISHKSVKYPVLTVDMSESTKNAIGVGGLLGFIYCAAVVPFCSGAGAAAGTTYAAKTAEGESVGDAAGDAVEAGGVMAGEETVVGAAVE